MAIKIDMEKINSAAAKRKQLKLDKLLSRMNLDDAVSWSLKIPRKLHRDVKIKLFKQGIDISTFIRLKMIELIKEEK